MQSELPSNPAQGIAEALFPALCRELVVDRDALKVEVKHGSASTAVVVRATPEDTGNCIGRNGRAVRSLQLIAFLAGQKHGWPVRVHVESQPGANPPPEKRPEDFPLRAWDSADKACLLGSVLHSFLERDAVVSHSDVSETTSFEVVLDAAEPEHRCELFVKVPELPEFGSEPVAVQRRLQGDDAVRFALSTLFSAMGRMSGRGVVMSYVRPGASRLEPQPASAAGRFAPELEAR